MSESTKEFKSNYGMVRFGDMMVDYVYQRPADKARIEKICGEFNPNKAKPVQISQRDNGLKYIWDGQHTACGMALHSYREKTGTNEYQFDVETQIPCIISYGMTQKDEARMFATQSDNVKTVTGNQKLNARCAAGDPEVVGYKNYIESYGIECDFGITKSPKKGVISNHSRCLKIYNKDKQRLGNIIKLCLDCWGDDNDAFRYEIIDGINYFYDKYSGDFVYDELVNKLKTVSPLKIIRDGRGNGVLSGKKAYAFVIANMYNKKKRYNRLDINKIIKSN